MKKSTLVGMTLLIGMFSLLNNLSAQDSEGTRRSLRGTRLSEPPPGGSTDPTTAGGADPALGTDPTRGEGGRPEPQDPFGGAGEGESPEVDDPFSNDPNGGAGEGESPEVDDPFSQDPNGGAGTGHGVVPGGAGGEGKK